jgi:hypothetical protein
MEIGPRFPLTETGEGRWLPSVLQLDNFLVIGLKSISYSYMRIYLLQPNRIYHNKYFDVGFGLLNFLKML